MPLEHSSSPAAFSRNLHTLFHDVGKSPHVQSREQALAIAYATQRRGAGKANGGVAGYDIGGGINPALGAGAGAGALGMMPGAPPSMPPTGIAPPGVAVGPGGVSGPAIPQSGPMPMNGGPSNPAPNSGQILGAGTVPMSGGPSNPIPSAPGGVSGPAMPPWMPSVPSAPGGYSGPAMPPPGLPSAPGGVSGPAMPPGMPMAPGGYSGPSMPPPGTPSAPGGYSGSSMLGPMAMASGAPPVTPVGRAVGGPSNPPWYVRNEARNLSRPMHVGPVLSAVPGRTDNHRVRVPSGSYVLPATMVSSLGQGNSVAGLAGLTKMFGGSSFGIPAPHIPHGSLPKPPAPQMTMGAFAGGGYSGDQHGDGVPVDISGGEFVIPASVIIARYGSLKRGHAYLDDWVMAERKKEIATLRKLPPPAKKWMGGAVWPSEWSDAA